MKKKILYGIIALVLLIMIALIGGACYMLAVALDNFERSHVADYDRVKAEYPETADWIDSLQTSGLLRDTFLLMPTGERAHAVYARCADAQGRTAVVVHGHMDSHVGMMQIAYIYHKVLGYNIIVPDLHAHGQSDGRFAGMGWNDRNDVAQWVSMAENTFGDGDSVRIVVHGISMGAATTMCLSGEDTTQSIRCYIEDCGYTSVWDEFSSELRKRYGLPPFPLMYVASGLCNLAFGWNFTEASPLKMVKSCQKPMLFIHGDVDTYVPTWMVYKLYEAKQQPKELWIAQGSAHATAYRDHKEEYISRVRAFVERYIE